MHRLLVAFCLSFVAFACGGQPEPLDPISPDEAGRGDQSGPCDPSVYPCGPYGFQEGATIRNLSHPGIRARSDGGLVHAGEVTTVSLADYYADKSIKAIVLTASAEWCDPCKAEQAGLVSLHKEFLGRNPSVAIFEAVVEDADGLPATIDVARRWARDHRLTFDVVIDPTGILKPYYDINAFPMNVVIRTSDMKITWQTNGVDPAGLRSAIDQILKAP